MTSSGKAAPDWSALEHDILRDRFPSGMTRAEVLEALPGRSWEAIKKRAYILRVARRDGAFKRYAYLRDLDGAARAWLAAALDFEGTIGMARHMTKSHGTLDVYISISNTNLALIDRFAELLGIGESERKHGRVGHIKLEQRQLHHKACYQFTCSSMPLLSELLVVIEPYLVAKREQAQLVLRFIAIQSTRAYKGRGVPTPEQLASYWRVKELNHRGVHQ